MRNRNKREISNKRMQMYLGIAIKCVDRRKTYIEKEQKKEQKEEEKKGKKQRRRKQKRKV